MVRSLKSWFGVPLAVAAVGVLSLGSGSAEARARHAGKPAAPRDVVEAFDNLILAHKPREAIERYIAPGFVEHDPIVPVDGKDGLLRYMREHGWEQNGDHQMRDIIDRTISQGEWVVVHHHIFRHPGDRAQVFVDIFRVRGGLITEHWDVMQEVPEHSENKHTMY